jgi:hypothetical protein
MSLGNGLPVHKYTDVSSNVPNAIVVACNSTQSCQPQHGIARMQTVTTHLHYIQAFAHISTTQSNHGLDSIIGRCKSVKTLMSNGIDASMVLLVWSCWLVLLAELM